MPTRAAAALGLLLAAGLAGPLAAQDPLSAIDWLSRSVAEPVAPPGTDRPGPPVTEGSALPQDVTVTTLDGPNPDAAGLLPPEVTGFPRALWGLGTSAEIAGLIRRERLEALPGLQSTLITLLLAEADPPADSTGRGDLLVARVDKLLDMGALDQARALLDAAGPQGADLFRRRFDVALLTGAEDQVCQEMRASPQFAPTFPARVFCLARSGDWNAAALTLRTAQALGHVSAEEDALLSRFLDPDLYEGDPILVPPGPVTPLTWRIYEAIGEPLPTATLPLAFAHAELRPTAGWKAQIEAAERLTRAGAIEPNLLLGLYTERDAAASGGVWERVDAFQRFDAALMAGDLPAVERALPVVWALMTEAELEVPFSKLFGERLAGLALTEDAARIALRAGLLSPVAESVARRADLARVAASDPVAAFVAGLARGDHAAAPPTDGLARAILPAFAAPSVPADLQALLDQARLGEAVLRASDRIASGLTGDLRGVTEGLALLRKVGMEPLARRTAIELMLLERRG